MVYSFTAYKLTYYYLLYTWWLLFILISFSTPNPHIRGGYTMAWVEHDFYNTTRAKDIGKKKVQTHEHCHKSLFRVITAKALSTLRISFLSSNLCVLKKWTCIYLRASQITQMEPFPNQKISYSSWSPSSCFWISLVVPPPTWGAYLVIPSSFTTQSIISEALPLLLLW